MFRGWKKPVFSAIVKQQEPTPDKPDTVLPTTHESGKSFPAKIPVVAKEKKASSDPISRLRKVAMKSKTIKIVGKGADQSNEITAESLSNLSVSQLKEILKRMI